MKLRFKNLFAVFSAICLLTSCTSADKTGNSTAEATETTTTAAAETAESTAESASSKTKVNYITIEVQTVKYEDEMLTFIYEDKEYSAACLSDENFKDDTFYVENFDNLLSEQIINNPYGETVTAKLSISEDMQKIKMCDVIEQNGSYVTCKYYDTTSDDYDAEKCRYTLERTGGSKCRIYNFEESYEGDLNDLPQLLKVDFDEEIVDIIFDGYKFTDGKFLLHDIGVRDETKTENEYFTDPENDYLSFFATVQKVADDTAEILLNDGVTTCTVPSYFNDGEVTEGLRVMVTLDADKNLYGSGEHYESDFAVFYTNEERFMSYHEFDDIAYAIKHQTDTGWQYVTKEKAASE